MSGLAQSPAVARGFPDLGAVVGDHRALLRSGTATDDPTLTTWELDCRGTAQISAYLTNLEAGPGPVVSAVVAVQIAGGPWWTVATIGPLAAGATGTFSGRWAAHRVRIAVSAGPAAPCVFVAGLAVTI